MAAHITELFRDEEDYNRYIALAKEKISILFVGKLGIGKSSLVNAMMGRKVAREGTGPNPVTSEIESYECTFHIREIGRNVVVKMWDTPGLGAASDKDEDKLKKLAKHFKEMDHVFYCLDMSRRLERSALHELEAFSKKTGPDLWKYITFVLTFANQALHTDQSESRVEDFEKDMATWIKGLHTALTRKLKISEDIVKKIPIVPAGYGNDPLPDREDWFSALWTTAFKRTRPEAQPAMLAISASRMRQSDSSHQAENPEDMYIYLDAQYQGYTVTTEPATPLSSVSGAVIVGITTVAGAVTGGLLGILGGPVGIAIGAASGASTGLAAGVAWTKLNTKEVIKTTITANVQILNTSLHRQN